MNGWNNSDKMNGNIYWPLMMIGLDSGGQKSRSQQV